MKRKIGLQEDEGDDNGILNKSSLLPNARVQEANLDATAQSRIEKTTKATSEFIAGYKIHGKKTVVRPDNLVHDQNGVTVQRPEQNNFDQGKAIEFLQENNKEVLGDDENIDSDTSDFYRPGAFAIKGTKDIVAIDDGTVQYSMGTVMTTQPPENLGENKKIHMHTNKYHPIEAEKVIENSKGTSTDIFRKSIAPLWEKATAIMSIHISVLCIVAAVIMTIFFTSKENGRLSFPRPSTTASVAGNSTSEPLTDFPALAPSPTSVQQQITEILLEYFPRLPNSDDQQKALDWLLTDDTSLTIVSESSFAASNHTQEALLERFVLAIVYFATNGTEWHNNNLWLSESFVCQWYGVQCLTNVGPSAVDYLDLDENSLSGPIPTYIGLLTSLTWLSLSNNALIGSIPTEMRLLSRLTWLNLSQNTLTGSIPSEVGLLSSLTGLGVSQNTLGGSIPTEMGLLTSLTVIGLSQNALTGSIPTEIGLLTNLSWLYSFSNTLTGSIPTEIGLSTGLNYLYLYQNSLTGSIPTEIGLLTNLIYFYTDKNDLTGSIPTEMALLTRLEVLRLSDNPNITGTISSEVAGFLTSLNTCLMGGNPNLSGIPEDCLGNYGN